jgi:adenylate cyclase
MDGPATRIAYEFGEFCVDVTQRLLRSRAEGEPVPLTTKAFETLLYLVEHRGELVDKAALMKAVWPNVVVEENNLNQNISALRKALGEVPGEHRFILTVPGRGYRFVAEVKMMPATKPTPPVAPAPVSTDSATLSAPRASIAVVPFANLTGDPSKEYLSDGMAEELIHVLCRIPGLKVPSRTSSFAYKGRQIDVRQIARDLGVATVLEGSVRSAGERIRVVAQLVNASTGFHVWSHSWDRQFGDLFKVQDELAGAIVRALGLSANGSASGSLAQAPPTSDLEAYQLYLQGLSLRSRLSEQNLLRAIELFEQASARDPNFTRAVAAAITARGQLTSYGITAYRTLAETEREASRALALDPGLAEAHVVLGVVNGCRGRFLDAEKHFRSAISIDNAAARLPYAAQILGPVGHLRQSLHEREEAYRLAPDNSAVAVILALGHMILGNDAEALRYIRLAVDLGSSERVGALAVVQSHAALRAKRYDEAAEKMFAVLPVALRTQLDPAALKLAYLALGDASHKPAALDALRQLDVTVGDASIDLLLQIHVVLLYTLLGSLDRAFEQANRFLDRFAESGEIGQPGVWGTLWFPEMRPFREDSRFAAFATRLGLMDYWKQYGPPDDCELRNGKLMCR